MIKIITCSLLILVTACNSTKESAEESVTNSSTNLQNEKMKAAGFTEGTIETGKTEEDCKIMIKVADGRYFESTDIPENFSTDGMKIWFTYTGLRRMSRCQKANPIAILDIKERQ